ncbi:hypothetical protein VFPBJ_11443 [Purpureocillium lilacinum]|uniref:Uncharacterized protein n=1 Tax=Purpureocillium lilacinum TaxID=33203 RepID=A0A179F7W5_PURLI|nr:hypothetical protein VFPBJ_11443 [Purpureocillium lilacinum]
MGSLSGLTYAQAAKKQHTALLATKYACQTVQAQPPQPVPVITPFVAADNSVQAVKHIHSDESLVSTGVRLSSCSHVHTRGDLQPDTPTGARKWSKGKCDNGADFAGRLWRAKSDAIPSQRQCADTQQPRRPLMTNTKSGAKQISDHMTMTETKQECVIDPARIGLSEAPMPSVNIWSQRREAQSTAAKPAATTAGGAISGDPTPALREGFKDTIDPGLYAFQALEGETQLRKTGNIAQPEQNGIGGSTVTERNTTAIKFELLFPIDGSFSWPAPMKEEKERVAGSFCPHDKTGTQAFTFQAKPRHKQKWVAYNYVPSVKFEIQISPLRRSKPRRGGQSASFANSSDVICSRERTETTSLLSARTRSDMDPSDAEGQKRTQRKNSGAQFGDPASFHPAVRIALSPISPRFRLRRLSTSFQNLHAAQSH